MICTRTLTVLISRRTITTRTPPMHTTGIPFDLSVSFLIGMDIVLFMTLLSPMMKTSSFIDGIEACLKVYAEDKVLLDKRAQRLSNLSFAHPRKRRVQNRSPHPAVSVYLSGTRTAHSGAWPPGEPRRTAPRSRSVPSGNRQTAQRPLQDKRGEAGTICLKKKMETLTVMHIYRFFPKSHNPMNLIKLTALLCFLKVSSC